jgi:hypothetical protein
MRASEARARFRRVVVGDALVEVDEVEDVGELDTGEGDALVLAEPAAPFLVDDCDVVPFITLVALVPSDLLVNTTLVDVVLDGNNDEDNGDGEDDVIANEDVDDICDVGTVELVVT